jgi:hypothetical protein
MLKNDPALLFIIRFVLLLLFSVETVLAIIAGREVQAILLGVASALVVLQLVLVARQFLKMRRAVLNPERPSED